MFRVNNCKTKPESLKHFIGVWHIQILPPQFLCRKISITTPGEDVTRCPRHKIKFEKNRYIYTPEKKMPIFGTDRNEVEMRPRLTGENGDFVRGQPQHQTVMNT